MSMKREFELKRTALAMFRAACNDDDAGLAALQATVDDAQDGQLIGHAINELHAGALAADLRGIPLNAFLDAYGRAIDKTEQQLLRPKPGP